MYSITNASFHVLSWLMVATVEPEEMESSCTSQRRQQSHLLCPSILLELR